MYQDDPFCFILQRCNFSHGNNKVSAYLHNILKIEKVKQLDQNLKATVVRCYDSHLLKIAKVGFFQYCWHQFRKERDAAPWCGKSVRSWCDGSLDQSFMVDRLSYFSFQPVLNGWCNKGRVIRLCSILFWYVLSCLWDGAYKRALVAHMWRQRVSSFVI